MKIMIDAKPKEIAALALVAQGRQEDSQTEKSEAVERMRQSLLNFYK